MLKTTPNENKYLFNNKELQDEQLGGVNLDWYAFDFRMYDPALGRFTCLDPIAEDFYHVTPYNYAENSPIANVDLWGLQKLPFQVHMAMTQGNPIAGAVSFAADWLSNKATSGLMSMTEGAMAKSENTALHNTSNGYTENVPEGTRAIREEVIDNAATAQTLSGVVEHYGTYQAAMTGAMGLLEGAGLNLGLRGTVGQVSKQATTKGVSVIGPRDTYRQFAKKIGANFLDVTDDAWSESLNKEFLQGVVERGDDVVFAGEFNPALFDPNSTLGWEINTLIENGYQWADDYSRLFLK